MIPKLFWKAICLNQRGNPPSLPTLKKWRSISRCIQFQEWRPTNYRNLLSRFTTYWKRTPESTSVKGRNDISMRILLFCRKRCQEQGIIIRTIKFKSCTRQREIGNFGKPNILKWIEWWKRDRPRYPRQEHTLPLTSPITPFPQFRRNLPRKSRLKMGLAAMLDFPMWDQIRKKLFRCVRLLLPTRRRSTGRGKTWVQRRRNG